MPKVINVTAPDGDGIVTTGQSLDDTIYAGNGIQTVYGNAGNDYLVAASGDQSIYGGSGSDTIVAGYGNQTLDGGSGWDTLDFSRLSGHLDIDPDLHIATLTDPVSGAVLYTYGITSFDKIIGTDAGNDFHAAANTARIYVGGAGDDHYFSESGGDTVVSGAGADVFGWMKKYVAVGHVDTITDFSIGQDRLDLSDFLKGQSFKPASYADVVHLAATVDANGQAATMVQTLAGGTWHDTVLLTGIDPATVTLHDVGL